MSRLDVEAVSIAAINRTLDRTVSRAFAGQAGPLSSAKQIRLLEVAPLVRGGITDRIRHRRAACTLFGADSVWDNASGRFL